MKIDLHCHTKQTKSGDSKGRNVTPELFRQKVMDADVKIVAITNHNAFDYDQYITLKNNVSEFCAVWPGVELDICGSNNRKFHLIVVANPDNAASFAQGIVALFAGKNPETAQLDFQQVYDTLHTFDVIYISHFYKSPSISEEDRMTLLQTVGDPSRVFCEPSNHRSLGVFANHEYSVLIGSDVHDWNQYEKSTFAELRLPVESFSQFCLLAKRDSIVVDTLLNKKKVYELIASPYKNVTFPLRIYADVNIIFGQKGTGKSEILDSLHQNMLDLGLSCEKYVGAEKDDSFNSLLKTKEMEKNFTKLNISDCSDAFNGINNWSDNSPTMISNYCDWYLTRNNSANKKRMKLTEATFLGERNLLDYSIHANDYRYITTAIECIDKIQLSKYLSHPDISAFQDQLSLLKNSIRQKFKSDVIEQYAHRLTDFSIERIKLHADKNTDTVSRPPTTGFRDFAFGRLKLRKMTQQILLNLDAPVQNERDFLGELDGKGKIYINSRYRMLCHDSKTAEFFGAITSLRELVTLLTTAHNSSFSTNLSTAVAAFNQKCLDMKVKSLEPFMGLSKQIVLETGEEYKPSNGEKGILLLQQKLRKEADAYFLDEPELGMGNSYIDMNIRPLIISLAKRHKAVVIATHNANIAVRTLPYTSILRVHQNGMYTTYVGNPFNDRLVNINNANDVRSWATESMYTLEGGEEAFYERKDIYESKNT